MPHTTMTVKVSALGIVLTAFGHDANRLKTTIARIVANAFNEIAGESYEVGKHSKFDKLATSPSCPADVVLQILIWWNERNAHKQTAIRKRIERDLAALLGADLKIEVFINAVDAPKPQRNMVRLRRKCVELNGTIWRLAQPQSLDVLPIEVDVTYISTYKWVPELRRLGIIETVRRGGGGSGNAEPSPTRIRILRANLTTDDLEQLLDEAG